MNKFLRKLTRKKRIILLLILITIPLILVILLFRSSSTNTVEDPFYKTYGLTRQMFNDLWQKNEGYEIQDNTEYKTSQQLSYPSQWTELESNFSNLKCLRQAVGNDAKIYLDCLNVSSSSKLDIDTLLLGKTDEISSITLQDNLLTFFNQDKKIVSVSTFSNAVVLSENEKTAVENFILNVESYLGKSQESFVDKLNPNGQTKFYFDKGIATYSNPVTKRFEVFVLPLSKSPNQALMIAIGLNGRYDTGNPNYIR